MRRKSCFKFYSTITSDQLSYVSASLKDLTRDPLTFQGARKESQKVSSRIKKKFVEEF